MVKTRAAAVLAAAAISLAIAMLDAGSPAGAQQLCMTTEEMREAVEAGRAVPAIAASRAARGAAPGEVVRIRLCVEEQKYVYRVTTLRRDGRVAHVTIDGASGNVAAVR
jgi:uncharacterized membrane protein YkoI